MFVNELQHGEAQLFKAFCRPRGSGQALATSQVRHTLGLERAWACY